MYSLFILEKYPFLEIGMAVFFTIGLYYRWANPNKKAEDKAASLGTTGVALYRVSSTTYWLLELYFLPILLAKYTGLLWLRHFRLILVFIPFYYFLKKEDSWLRARDVKKEENSHD